MTLAAMLVVLCVSSNGLTGRPPLSTSSHRHRDERLASSSGKYSKPASGSGIFAVAILDFGHFLFFVATRRKQAAVF